MVAYYADILIILDILGRFSVRISTGKPVTITEGASVLIYHTR
jgi:hypothetical protein